MFFALSKTLDLLVTPLAWGLLLAVAGAVVGLRWSGRRRLASGLVLAGVAILLVFSLAPVANALQHATEDDAPSSFRAGEPYDAVVLLCGVVDLTATKPGGPPALSEGVERLLATYDLLRKDQARVVVITGGAFDGDSASLTEASVLGRQLIDWGISPDRIILEEKARNTHENAVFAKRIVEEHGWHKVLVVTSAFHMRRAKECFNAVGLRVDTLPVDFRAYDPERAKLNLLPRAEYLDQSSVAIRELFGRVVYRVRGYATRDE